MTDHPLKVRYERFSGWSDWTTCHDAKVSGEVLVIHHDSTRDNLDLIPLHVIRGHIEIRPNDGNEQ